MKKWIMCLVAVSSLGLTSACTDEEAALGTGLAIGAIGGVAIANNRDRNRNNCHTYRDYYGRLHNDCRRGNYYGRRHYPRHPRNRRGDWHLASVQTTQNQNLALIASSDTVELSPIAMGREFNMSFDSANQLLIALEQSAYYGNQKYVKDMGLSSSDGQRLANKKLPSNNGIKRLAKTLNQDPEATKNMISRIVQAM